MEEITVDFNKIWCTEVGQMQEVVLAETLLLFCDLHMNHGYTQFYDQARNRVWSPYIKTRLDMQLVLPLVTFKLYERYGDI